jgi:hypothetical protein
MSFIKMNLKLEIVLLFLGGMIRLIVISTDIWYLIKGPINSGIFWYIGIASLFAPTAIMLMIYSVVLIKECKNHQVTSERFQIIILFVIGDSIGLNYFVFTFILCRSDILSGDFYIIDSMFRSAALINSLFQTMPQIVYQALNNQIYNNWKIFPIFSIGISTISLFYTITKLVYAIDKVKQFEKVSNIGSETQVQSTRSNKKASAVDLVISTDNQHDEVYSP